MARLPIVRKALKPLKRLRAITENPLEAAVQAAHLLRHRRRSLPLALISGTAAFIVAAMLERVRRTGVQPALAWTSRTPSLSWFAAYARDAARCHKMPHDFV